MSKDDWKVGDWVELRGKRYLVFRVNNTSCHAVPYSGGNAEILFDHRDEEVKYLTDCDGWDWKPERSYRAMTRFEFIKAWMDRGWCPLINVHGELEIVSQTLRESIFIYGKGWRAFSDIGDYRFASDDSRLVVEVNASDLAEFEVVK